jgi:hypothetical protein
MEVVLDPMQALSSKFFTKVMEFFSDERDCAGLIKPTSSDSCLTEQLAFSSPSTFFRFFGLQLGKISINLV